MGLRKNTITLLGLPDRFGEVLLILTLVFALGPYLAGLDFGVLKVPAFPPALVSTLRIAGPFSFLFAILLHIPFWSKTTNSDTPPGHVGEGKEPSEMGNTGQSERGNRVYRWWSQGRKDHLYTTDSNGELAGQRGYISEGPKFRLFPSDAAGTAPIYRWYSSNRLDHFYTADCIGEVAVQSGYVQEGLLGYIAVKQLADTVPLYRWWNSTFGDHFYTTDPDGEQAPVLGYVSEGILGYVWPVSSAQSDGSSHAPRRAFVLAAVAATAFAMLMYLVAKACSSSPLPVLNLVPERVSNTFVYPASDTRAAATIARGQHAYSITLTPSMFSEGFAGACWNLSQSVDVEKYSQLVFWVQTEDSGEFEFKAERADSQDSHMPITLRVNGGPWSAARVPLSGFERDVQHALGRLCVGNTTKNHPGDATINVRQVEVR